MLAIASNAIWLAQLCFLKATPLVVLCKVCDLYSNWKSKMVAIYINIKCISCILYQVYVCVDTTMIYPSVNVFTCINWFVPYSLSRWINYIFIDIVKFQAMLNFIKNIYFVGKWFSSRGILASPVELSDKQHVNKKIGRHNRWRIPSTLLFSRAWGIFWFSKSI